MKVDKSSVNVCSLIRVIELPWHVRSISAILRKNSKHHESIYHRWMIYDAYLH